MNGFLPFRADLSREGQSIGLSRGFGWFDHFLEAGYLTNDAADAKRFSETADKGAYLVTVIDGGGDNAETITVADDAKGGWLKCVTNDADNDALNIQLNGEPFLMEGNGGRLVWEMRVRIEDVSAVDWFFGMSVNNTNVLNSLVDGIGFRALSGSTTPVCVSAKDSVETVLPASTITATDAGWLVLQMHLIGLTTARFFINDTKVGEIATNLPDNEYLSPLFQVRNFGAAANTFYVDYLAVGQGN